MTSTTGYFRRVGTVRPSHLMFTAGVGALIDLPHFSVLVKGLETWNFSGLADYVIDEPRLRHAVNRALQLYGQDQITELRAAPWMEGADNSPKEQSAQGTGVPVTPFPQWMRCTACYELAAIDSGVFAFVNNNPRAPHEAKFVHDCKAKKPLAVAARFTLVCTRGHLDEFPYVQFVHRGRDCGTSRPRLRMLDHGGNQAANVTLECVACGARRNIREAMGADGQEQLPACRGRHPHLGTYAERGCDEEATLMVAGASNHWFPMTLSALALPPARGASISKLLDDQWPALENVNSVEMYQFLATLPGYGYLREYDPAAVLAAIEARRNGGGAETVSDTATQSDLLGPEWDVLSGPPPAEPSDDFALAPVTVPDALGGLFSDVRQVERLREARALIGFTRLDAPDRESEGIATPVRLSRSAPSWVPASEVRGEGIFLRVHPGRMAEWVADVRSSPQMTAHREAFARFRDKRRSDRLTTPFDPMYGWPGERYFALHTLSHLLIRTIALECGYNSASLAERIYAGDDDDPRTGILLYTAVPDSEGTLGGLVSLARAPHFERIVRRALRDAAHCSSDPLCAERLPCFPDDYLHGAACHVCLFVSETTCERGNRFLDRRFLLPLGDDPAPVLTPVGLLP
ncbi:hypothetical protein AQ490_22175 [Wenjunlia vitaminophila]|uniref:MrfA-like Zn-binding domain-containing protein n=1 Tax=Wenjunlia vitaminophila TaxID=76728 RepID=A0A0T6LSD6_WENVI|nr:DUF1998 domain-containing protein [Wenjunlia vitaminophila]KRV49021.1 hypothetical protein AQ490_22175 [Wenjunlia vitaminophila]